MCSGCPQVLSIQALGVPSFRLSTRNIFLIIFATNRDVKAVNSSCSFFSKFCKNHFICDCSLQTRECKARRMNCPCSVEEVGLSQHWSSLALLSICLLYFRAPFRQQTDSAVEKNAEGSCASTPLGVITNRAVLSAANGTGNAGAASAPGKDLSAEEARERRRSVRSGLCWPPLWAALTWW